MRRFENKTVIVTGAGGEIGGSLAKAFHAEGAKVVLLGRTLSSLEAKAKGMEKARAMVLTVDVLDQKRLEEVRQEVVSSFGGVDVLVNAAGGNMSGATIRPDQSIFDINMPDFHRVVDLNLYGTVLPSLVFGESMLKRGEGVILNVSSLAVDRILTRVAGYSASKAAVENFTKWMAVELALKFGEKFRVNALTPGFFIGNQNRRLLTKEDGTNTDRGNAIINNTPMKRFGDVAELNEAALFLCSPGASFVTGIVLAVDGGFSAFSGV